MPFASLYLRKGKALSLFSRRFLYVLSCGLLLLGSSTYAQPAEISRDISPALRLLHAPEPETGQTNSSAPPTLIEDQRTYWQMRFLRMAPSRLFQEQARNALEIHEDENSRIVTRPDAFWAYQVFWSLHKAIDDGSYDRFLDERMPPMNSEPEKIDIFFRQLIQEHVRTIQNTDPIHSAHLQRIVSKADARANNLGLALDETVKAELAEIRTVAIQSLVTGKKFWRQLSPSQQDLLIDFNLFQPRSNSFRNALWSEVPLEGARGWKAASRVSVSREMWADESRILIRRILNEKDTNIDQLIHQLYDWMRTQSPPAYRRQDFATQLELVTSFILNAPRFYVEFLQVTEFGMRPRLRPTAMNLVHQSMLEFLRLRAQGENLYLEYASTERSLLSTDFSQIEESILNAREQAERTRSEAPIDGPQILWDEHLLRPDWEQERQQRVEARAKQAEQEGLPEAVRQLRDNGFNKRNLLDRVLGLEALQVLGPGQRRRTGEILVESSPRDLAAFQYLLRNAIEDGEAAPITLSDELAQKIFNAALEELTGTDKEFYVPTAGRTGAAPLSEASAQVVEEAIERDRIQSFEASLRGLYEEDLNRAKQLQEENNTDVVLDEASFITEYFIDALVEYERETGKLSRKSPEHFELKNGKESVAHLVHSMLQERELMDSVIFGHIAESFNRARAATKKDLDLGRKQLLLRMHRAIVSALAAGIDLSDAEAFNKFVEKVDPGIGASNLAGLRSKKLSNGLTVREDGDIHSLFSSLGMPVVAGESLDPFWLSLFQYNNLNAFEPRDDLSQSELKEAREDFLRSMHARSPTSAIALRVAAISEFQDVSILGIRKILMDGIAWNELSQEIPENRRVDLVDMIARDKPVRPEGLVKELKRSQYKLAGGDRALLRLAEELFNRSLSVLRLQDESAHASLPKAHFSGACEAAFKAAQSGK